jgi:hypothetical protein
LAGSFHKEKIFRSKRKTFYIGKTPGKAHFCCTGKLIFQARIALYKGKTGLFCIILTQKGTVAGGARLQLFGEGSDIFLACYFFCQVDDKLTKLIVK